EGAAALAGQPLGWAFGVLQKLCHDLLAQASGAAPRFFDAADLPPVPRGPAAVEALTAWAAELRQAARTADHPFQPGLALEAQAARALKALHFAPPSASRP
ncbi:MAG: DNA polymerase III subunit delta', partial [Pseudomonadota bacterium]